MLWTFFSFWSTLTRLYSPCPIYGLMTFDPVPLVFKGQLGRKTRKTVKLTGQSGIVDIMSTTRNQRVGEIRLNQAEDQAEEDDILTEYNK
jgi:hypothetical protein